MTEADWLACSDAEMMLRFLRESRLASERKLRLFGAACCRRVWDWMTDRRSRKGVAVAEAHADGLAGDDELESAREGTGRAWTTVWGDGWHIYQSARAAHFTCCAGTEQLLLVPTETWNATRNSVLFGKADERVLPDTHASYRRRQTSLLRDFVGNPFRPLPAIDPAWLAWHDNTVKRLAEGAYEERELPGGTLDSSRLAVLADALADAGASNVELLEGLRGPDPHYRGFWCLDVLLGKS